MWTHHPPYGFSSFNDTSTLPVWLEGAGYNTVFLGKYLNGYGKQPTSDGEDSVRYIPPGWTDWRGSPDGGIPADDPMNGSTYRYWDTTLNVNGFLEAHPGEYQTRMLGDQSVDIVRTYALSGEPFFLWASYLAPHHGGPIEADDPLEVRRDDGKLSRFVTPAVPADGAASTSRSTSPPASPPSGTSPTSRGSSGRCRRSTSTSGPPWSRRRGNVPSRWRSSTSRSPGPSRRSATAAS